MTLPFRRKKKAPLVDDHAGETRVDPRTKNLTKRLRVGRVAVIDHSDIDRVSVEALVTCNPLVVVNAARSTSGGYPNLGPGVLNATGVPLVDDCGPEVMEVDEGMRVRVTGVGEVYTGEELVTTGTIQTAKTIAANQEGAKASMNIQFKTFTTNTMRCVGRERGFIFDGVRVPDVKTSFGGRHALTVVRDYRYREGLAALRPYTREYRPIMVGMDSGADAILEEGYKLDMVVGDMDSTSDKALAYGAGIVVRTYRGGYAPGSKHVDKLGVDHVVFPYTGTSENVAMLLADDKGTKLIVVLGTRNTLIEFLGKRRPGMVSALLTHLTAEGRLIDAKGISQLYRSRMSNWQIFVLLLVGCIAIGAAMASTTTGRVTFGLVSVWFGSTLRWFELFF